MSTAKEVTPYITVVQAPGIPREASRALKADYRKAIADPNFILVTNYEVRVDIVETPKGVKLLVAAPQIPTSMVDELRKMVDKARRATKPQDRLVVLNYECRIDSIPE